MTTVITIHHFDDESERIRWIPGALLDRYWMRHPEWLSHDDCFNDSDPSMTHFQLYPSGQTWLVRHRLYRTAAQFRDEFPVEAQNGDVALIDMMDGSATPPGVELYAIATTRLGGRNVFVLTGFPTRPELTSIDPDRLFAKPPDASAVINAIFDTLALEARV